MLTLNNMLRNIKDNKFYKKSKMKSRSFAFLEFYFLIDCACSQHCRTKTGVAAC